MSPGAGPVWNCPRRQKRLKGHAPQPPIITVGQPGGKIFPVGEGMGATQLACKVKSPTRAAGILPIRTVADPLEIIPGPAGTQPASKQGVVMSVTRAAGIFPIRQLGCPLTIASGIGGCGTGVGTRAGGWIGAWQCGASCKT
jgi:hypothetical protein